jgi:Na+/H+ antiporter NhaD/arsenite permease-like protein
LAVALVLIFIAAYAAIALEHPLKMSKSASALFGAGLLWTVYALSIGDHVRLGHELDETITATARITFFLLGAMTIVEVIDAHDGFAVITSRIRTRRLTGLLWAVSWVTFFLSAILDNLTTTIVMVTMMRKLLDRSDDRLLFASVIVIAANAGGAWSPMGDVTTTMLWIGGQVTALAIVKALLPASVINLVVPLIIVTLGLRGRPFAATSNGSQESDVPAFERNVMLALGLGVLVAVPAFKQVTHLPPFMGILFGLGTLWLAGEVLHKGKSPEERDKLTLAHALSRIDLSVLRRYPASGGNAGAR